jgi:hypothetical protein
MPAIKGQSQASHAELKTVTLWPCLHTADYMIRPRKGDFVLCTRCDDYREVMPSEGMLAAMSPEEMEGKSEPRGA